MTSRFRLSPPAVRDLYELAERLRRVSGLETSRRFARASRLTFQRYADMPGLGERHDSVKPNLAQLRIGRVDGFGNHLVFYRPVDEGIEIVRVLHGARDVERALEEGNS